MVSVTVVVSTCIMDVVVLIKTELVPKLSTELDDFIKSTNVEIVDTMLVACLSDLSVLLEEFFRAAIFVLTFSNIFLEYLRDFYVLDSELLLVLHL